MINKLDIDILIYFFTNHNTNIDKLLCVSKLYYNSINNLLQKKFIKKQKSIILSVNNNLYISQLNSINNTEKSDLLYTHYCKLSNYSTYTIFGDGQIFILDHFIKSYNIFIMNLYIYNSRTNILHNNLPKLNIKRQFAKCVTVSMNNTIYILVLGGYNPLNSNSPISVVEYLDVNDYNKGWRIMKNMEIALTHFEVTELNGKIYILGGRDKKWCLTNILHIFDLNTETWEYIELPWNTISRYDVLNIFTVNNKIWYTSSEDNSIIYIFDPITKQVINKNTESYNKCRLEYIYSMTNFRQINKQNIICISSNNYFQLYDIIKNKWTKTNIPFNLKLNNDNEIDNFRWGTII